MKKFLENPKVQFLTKWFLLIALLLLAAVFAVVNPQFLHFTNLMDMLRTSSIFGLMGIGMTLALAIGEINFSMGNILSLTGGIVGALMMYMPDGFYPVAVLAAILVSLLIGVIISYFIVDLGVPSFICTLAMQSVINAGVRYVMHDSALYSPNWGPSFTFFGQTMLFGQIPLLVVIFAAFAVGIFILYHKTRTGRYIFAVGANPTACRQVGIHIRGIKYLALILSCCCAGLAGVLYTSLSNGCFITMGTELQTPATSIAILGATFLTPGKFNIPGALVATILIVFIQNGTVTAGGAYYIKDIMQGLILLFSVALIALIRKEGLPKVSFGM